MLIKIETPAGDFIEIECRNPKAGIGFKDTVEYLYEVFKHVGANVSVTEAKQVEGYRVMVDNKCKCGCGQDAICACCGGNEMIRPHSPWHGTDVICVPCFLVWYDSGKVTREDIGAESLRLKAEGKYPWATPSLS